MPGLFQKGGFFDNVGDIFGDAAEFIAKLPGEIIHFGAELRGDFQQGGEALQKYAGTGPAVIGQPVIYIALGVLALLLIMRK